MLFRSGSDFLYLHGFDQLESSVQAEAVRFLTAVLPELGAKYPRLISGVQTVPPLSLIHIWTWMFPALL